MHYRVDEKGKALAARITQERVAVAACVGDMMVDGMVHLMPDKMADGRHAPARWLP